MSATISTANARTNFTDIVNKAAYGAEPVILTRRGTKNCSVDFHRRA